MYSEEVWKPVVEWEGYYEVSNLGRVRTVPRVIVRSDGTTQSLRGRIRKLQVAHDGRMLVMMCRDSRVQSRLVHRLVARAFLGEPAADQVVCHNDGDPTNNRAENLRWDTASANQMDRVAHGTHSRGERHNMVKLTERQVHEIRALCDSRSMLQREVADLYGIGQSMVSLIALRRKWDWLPERREVVA